MESGGLERNGWPRRGRGLCLNRRAKTILLQNGLLDPRDLEPIQVLDQPPPGCRVLDGIEALPPPYYDAEELARVKALLCIAWERHASTEKPVQATTLKKSLDMMRMAKRRRPDDFRQPASKKALQNLPANIPDNWAAVLAISNGGELNDECEVIAADHLQDMYQEKSTLVKLLFDEYPYENDLMPVVTAANGDWFCLVRAEAQANEAKVVRISHEDLSILHTWDDIARFIHDMLTDFYD